MCPCPPERMSTETPKTTSGKHPEMADLDLEPAREATYAHRTNSDEGKRKSS